MRIIEIFERVDGDTDIVYVEKKTKGVLAKVIATLSGNKSGKYTRLANRYKRVDRLTALLAKERKALNTQVKSEMESLFAAEDEVLTRVIETVSLTLTLSKVTGPTTREYFDTDGYVEALESLIPDLSDQINLLRKQYTSVQESTRAPSLRVKLKEGLWDKIKATISSTVQKIKSSLPGIDSKLDALKDKMAADEII